MRNTLATDPPVDPRSADDDSPATYEFKAGEVVDVTIKGVRVTGDQGPRGTVTIADEPGTHFVMPPQAKVERVAPPEWPPQAGDLWRDRDGDVWLTCSHEVTEWVMVCASGVASRTIEQALSRFGPLTLVHREDPADRDRGFEVDPDGAQ